MGWFGILLDPGGAAFALWQPKMQSSALSSGVKGASKKKIIVL
jgi:hypothetical protein